MKMKSVVLLAVALGCGLVAMLGVQQALSGDKKAPDSTIQVLVALEEIGPGTPLNEMNVQFKPWPKDAVPEGAVTKLEDYEQRALKSRSYPGEVIMIAKLGEKGAYGASSEIPKGMRVVTVAVDQTMTHSGMLLPGDRVDVMVTYKSQPQNGGKLVSKSKTVLQRVEVFATDSLTELANKEKAEIKAKNVSLLVDPQQAGLLKLAENMGSLTLVLRGKGDTTEQEPVTVDGSMFDDAVAMAQSTAPVPVEEPSQPAFVEFLKNQDQPQVAEATPAKSMWKIEIYAGEQKRIEEVELPEEAESTVETKL